MVKFSFGNFHQASSVSSSCDWFDSFGRKNNAYLISLNFHWIDFDVWSSLVWSLAKSKFDFIHFVQSLLNCPKCLPLIQYAIWDFSVCSSFFCIVLVVITAFYEQLNVVSFLMSVERYALTMMIRCDVELKQSNKIVIKTLWVFRLVSVFFSPWIWCVTRRSFCIHYFLFIVQLFDCSL